MSYPTTEEEALETICWSADVESVTDLYDTLEQVPRLRKIKLDRLAIAKFGHGVITEVSQRGKDVFDDAKLVEIPTKLEALARVEASYAPWMLNCMAGSISNADWRNPDPTKLDGLKRFANVCAEHGILSCAVTVLTSKAEVTVAAEFGRSSSDQVLFYTNALPKLPLTHLGLPATLLDLYAYGLYRHRRNR